MRPQWKTALAGAALCALAACSSSPGTANRPALTLPDASAFKTGTCSTIADPVLALGRFTYEKADAKSLTDADRAELVVQGEKIKTAHATAEPALADQMMNVLMSIGFVRIRVGGTYDPKLLGDVETKRMVLQTTCTA